MHVIKIIIVRLAHHFVLTIGFFGLTLCHLLALIVWPLGQFVGWSIHELETSTKQLQRLQRPRATKGRWR